MAYILVFTQVRLSCNTMMWNTFTVGNQRVLRISSNSINTIGEVLQTYMVVWLTWSALSIFTFQSVRSYSEVDRIHLV